MANKFRQNMITTKILTKKEFNDMHANILMHG